MTPQLLGPLTRSASETMLTLYREVACGCFSPAEDHAEARLSLDDLVRLREPSMFLARASGDSMIKAGIFDGDVLIIDRARQATSGSIVVARVGSEFVVKRLHLDGSGKVMLLPENEAYRPITLGDGEELEVWGVCVWNLHQLDQC